MLIAEWNSKKKIKEKKALAKLDVDVICLAKGDKMWHAYMIENHEQSNLTYDISLCLFHSFFLPTKLTFRLCMIINSQITNSV